MHSRRPDTNRTGFTLIELLVVISIITLLVSILMPGLRGAREQAKRAQCMSNLRQVAVALSGYVIEFQDFPILLTQAGGTIGWSTWTWGGWGGSNRSYWLGQAGGQWYVPTEKRPLSAYMFLPPNTDPGKEGPGADNIWGTRDDRVIEMPMFKCPSDYGSHQGANWDPAPTHQEIAMTAYDDIGTSYDLNMVWWYQTTGGFAARLEEGQKIWRRKLTQDPGRFMTTFEDPVDRALHHPGTGAHPTGLLLRGFHRQFSRHVVGFLDGHVEYLKLNTRKCREGRWTSVDEGITYFCGFAEHNTTHIGRKY